MHYKTCLLLICSMSSSPVIAADRILSSYQVIDAIPTSSGAQVTLQITITNAGDNDLFNITLIAGDPATLPAKLAIPDLRVNGMDSVLWSFDIPYSPDFIYTSPHFEAAVDAFYSDGTRMSSTITSVSGGSL